jgi:hypothetical protein
LRVHRFHLLSPIIALFFTVGRKLLGKNEAWRIAATIAKLPEATD